jgi:hypothetical protein
MAVTFIYDDTAKAPKNIDIDASAKKVKASKTVTTLQVQSIVLVYAHGGVIQARDASAVVLENSAKARTGHRGETLAARFSAWFATATPTARQKVKEIHLMSCHSGDNTHSAVRTLAVCPTIKTLFPNLERVVGVTGIIDQDNDSKGIRLKAGDNVLGYSKDITKNGLPRNTPGVTETAVP